MRSTRKLRLAWSTLLLLALAGCDIGRSSPSETLSAATANGLSYTLQISGDSKRQCTTTTVRSELPPGRPVLASSHSCGPPLPGGRPLLIQAHSSPQSLLVDVPVTGCGPVSGGPSHQALHPLRTRCSNYKPPFRVTILPAGSRVVLVGVPGAPVINFARHRCRIICISALG